MSESDNQALLLQVSADLSKLTKAFQKAQGDVDAGASKIEKRAKQMAQKIEQSVQISPKLAFLKVFDSSRLKVLDEGAAKLGVFGSALEDLGPYGIAAAGAIAAVTAALAGSKAAVEYADAIGDTAGNLHVTTDALQEYRYANRLAGGEIESVDEALASFNVTLGKAQAGIPKALKPFKELGFTKAQVTGFADAGAAIDAITKKLGGLSDVQKDAVIDQLGLSGLKPLLEQGADKVDALKKKVKELGLVMDQDLIARAGPLNDQFETLASVIDIQVKSALLDLAPVLVKLLDLTAHFATDIDDIVESFKKLPDQTDSYLNRQIAALKADNARIDAANTGNGLDYIRKNNNNRRIAAYTAQVQGNEARRGIDEMFGPDAQKKKGKGPANLIDQTAAAPDSSKKDLVDAELRSLEAQRSVYQALEGLTDDIEARRVIQKNERALDVQIAAKEKEARYAAIDKGKDSNKSAQKAEVDKQAAGEAELRAIRYRKEDAENQIDQAKQDYDRHRKLADAQIEELRAQEDLTTDRKERARIEHQILDIQKGIDDKARRNDLNAQNIRADAADPSVTHVTSDGGAQKAADAAHDALSAGIDQAAEGPFQQWVDDHVKGAQAVRDAFEQLRIEGVEGFNDALLDSIENTKNLGDAAKGLFVQLLNDFAKIKLGEAEAAPFKKGADNAGNGSVGDFLSALDSVFGGKREQGGPVWPGKAYIVGEKRPEVFMPSVPGHIVPSMPTVPARGSQPHITVALQSTYQIAGAINQADLTAAIGRAHDSAVTRAVNTVQQNFGRISGRYNALKG